MVQYGDFYSVEERKLPYESREEYEGELFAFLDLCLLGVCGKEDQGVMGKLSREEAAELFFAADHRKNRILETEKAGNAVFCWYEELCTRFPMAGWEEFAVLLAASVHVDRKYEKLYGRLQELEKAALPTAGLARQLFSFLFPDRAAREKGRDGRGLFGPLGLLEDPFPAQRGAGGAPVSVLAAPLKLRTEVLGYLGLSSACTRAFGVRIHRGNRPGERFVPVIHQRQQEEIISVLSWQKAKKALRPGFLHLWGEPENGQRDCFLAAARRLSLTPVFIDCTACLDMTEAEAALRSAALLVKLYGGILCLDRLEPGDKERGERRERFFLERAGELVFWFAVISGKGGSQFTTAGLERTEVLFPLLSAGEKLALWKQESMSYALEGSVDLSSLAEFYILTPDKIRGAFSTASLLARREKRERVSQADLKRAVSQYSASELGPLAEKKKAFFAWDDIILEEDQERLLHHICNQFRYREKVCGEWKFLEKAPYGNGISAIFHGAPGTGKTMAVQVIANDLGIDLYRVDASQLVSKYIGETEKNISELFSKAASVNGLLFFDEADALFSKRAEVKDSHDKNANAETAHLLQMFEDYGGIVILATNYLSNVDEAFKRRIKFSVEFRLPDAAMRRKLWESILTEPVKEHSVLDIRYFAEHFELSGSGIKEIILNASYMAAAEGCWPENRHLVEAVRLYYQKIGIRLSGEEFGYLSGEA